MNYEVLIDKLMQHFTSELFAGEIKAAKHDFNEWAGHFDEMSGEFEIKVAQFTDWYLFIRPLSDFKKPPIQLNVKESGFQMDSRWEEIYKSLVASRHSLFEFIKLKGKTLYIKDIFSGYKLTMDNSPIIHGFNKGEIFEARLIPHGHSFVFSNSFCFHPSQAAKFILKEVKEMRKAEPDKLESAREVVIRKLFKMRYKFEHYKHVALEEIYTNELKSL